MGSWGSRGGAALPTTNSYLDIANYYTDSLPFVIVATGGATKDGGLDAAANAHHCAADTTGRVDAHQYYY
eukprot:8360321-Pyramimonas_sp.AAC.1